MPEEKNKKEAEIAPEGKKSSSMMLIIIIVVLILVILIGAIVTILMMGGDSKTADKATEKTEKAGAEKKATPGMDESRTLDKIGILYPLDTFTVNLLSENGSRYLKAQVSLELSGKELTEELDAKKAVIRDRILRILSSKSVEEVSTLKGKDQLGAQIMQELNTMLKDGSINGVYFTDFVIQ
jgi:flagellar FliL protein